MDYRKTILIIILLFFSQKFFPQDKTDFDLLATIYEPQSNKIEYKQFTHENSNELQWIASGLLVSYKSFFSSQDGNRCVFHPSCSIYAIQSIKKKGIILGFADALDRLSRCNRLSPENYVIYEETDLFFDPVK